MRGLGLTLAAGSPVLLAACGEDDSGTSTDVDEANDLKLVQAARSLELAMVSAYTKVVTLLGPGAAVLGNQILTQEKQHANGFVTVIADLGGEPSPAKPQAEYDSILGLGKLRDQAAALAFASEIEQMAIFFYIDAVPKLTIGDLRATFASLATSEAEHDAVLSGIVAGGDPAKQVPSAFVPGTEPTLELT